MELECPVEHCDYTGPMSSVEGHISASTDGGHDGEAGSNFRAELRNQAERLADSTEAFVADRATSLADGASETTGDTVADTATADHPTGDDGHSDDIAASELEDTTEDAPSVEPVDEINAETDDDDSVPLPGGIGIETALVLAITFGLAAGYVGGELLRSSTASSGTDDDTDDDGGDNQNQNRGSGSVVGLS